MAKKNDKNAAAKERAAKKNKGKAKDDAAPGASIATHPRAAASIRRMKGWAGLAGFALAAVLSLQASVPMFQVGLRALGAGVAGYMLAWWFGVLIWRQLMIAEQRAAVEALERRRAEMSDPDPRRPEAQPAG